MRRTVPVVMLLAFVPAAWGQQAVSARAGLIQYVEGRVLLNDQPIAPKVNEFLQVDKDQTLATEDGRAEILLTPGAFLRLSENSSFRMISSSLSDTQLEVLSGSAMVEVEELLKDNAITLHAGKTSIVLMKHGLYRVDADGAAHFRVYDGEATVTSGDQTITAKKGREVELDQTLAVAKFDVDETDPFYRWSERRAGYVATANISSARSVMGGSGLGFNSGLGCNGLGYNNVGYNNVGYNSGVGYANGLGYNNGLGYGSGSLGCSNWVYNPWFGMYTYVPYNGYGYSPFGYAIYSPATVRYVTVQPTSSFATALNQRTISPPTVRAAANSSGTSVAGRMGVGGGSGLSNSGGSSSGVSSGGGGTAAGRISSSAPAAAPAAAGGGGGGGARSSGGGGGGGARGR